MKRKKATTSVFVTVFFVSMAFIAGYVTAQKTENVEWLGWLAVAKPSTSPDPRIHTNKTYDSLVNGPAKNQAAIAPYVLSSS